MGLSDRSSCRMQVAGMILCENVALEYVGHGKKIAKESGTDVECSAFLRKAIPRYVHETSKRDVTF